MQWLIGILFKSALDWVAKFIGDLIAKFRKDKANHEAAEAQAQQDTKKAAAITPESSKEQVSEAIDDELSHF